MTSCWLVAVAPAFDWPLPLFQHAVRQNRTAEGPAYFANEGRYATLGLPSAHEFDRDEVGLGGVSGVVLNEIDFFPAVRCSHVRLRGIST